MENKANLGLVFSRDHARDLGHRFVAKAWPMKWCYWEIFVIIMQVLHVKGEGRKKNGAIASIPFDCTDNGCHRVKKFRIVL